MTVSTDSYPVVASLVLFGGKRESQSRRDTGGRFSLVFWLSARKKVTSCVGCAISSEGCW
jgi:hypothetical protein